MTGAEIDAHPCPTCGVPTGVECTADVATCEARLVLARAHRLALACPTCRAVAGVPCVAAGIHGRVCLSRHQAAQPGSAARQLVLGGVER